MISFLWFRRANKWVLEMSWSSNHSLLLLKPFSADTSSEQDPNPLWLLLFAAGFTVGMPLFTACWLGVGGGLWGIYFCSGRLWGRLPVFVNYGLWITLSEILKPRSLKKLQGIVKYLSTANFSMWYEILAEIGSLGCLVSSLSSCVESQGLPW